MTNDFYIPRYLRYKTETLTETELLSNDGVIVVLAEPGAGKTRLLTSVANQLGVASQRASIFKAKSSVQPASNLILDALDEVAKLDPSGIDLILVRAQETGARKVILASRSSEWAEAQTAFLRECFSTEPMIVRLQALDEDAQKDLFHNYVPGEDFAEFKNQVETFALGTLLGNPQFLKLFADAYVESGKQFSSKSRIFQDAVRRLAYEANKTISHKGRPSVDVVLDRANEVFAKLLLSGSVGISVSDRLDDRQYPSLISLLSGAQEEALCILDTRLVTPTSIEGLHEPVHRIVAEYCAARYLVSRIEDSADPLSLRRCFSIVAPNSTVRDELHGLLGWMAALGGTSLQGVAIDLDPYAVLANGDPSQLLPSSKRQLLSCLKVFAESDPYFRRSDSWRTFSVAGFFTPEVMEDIRQVLFVKEANQQLKGLVLELLVGSDLIPLLKTEWTALMLDASSDLDMRMLAMSHLLTVEEYDYGPDCRKLIEQGDDDGLSIAAQMFAELGVELLGQDMLLRLLHASAQLSPGSDQPRVSGAKSRYFVKNLIRELEREEVLWLLDQLTDGLVCTCGAETAHDCDCRNGISKVVGTLLDCHFEKSEPPFDALRIWRWVGNLNFYTPLSTQQSRSVQVLQAHHKLRQSIHRFVLGGITDPEVVWRTRCEAFEWQCHSGLLFQPTDCLAILDYAFETDNLAIWCAFYRSHSRYTRARGPDPLRTRMRWQANQKPELMKLWSKSERDAKRNSEEHHAKWRRPNRRMKRRERLQGRIREANIAHLKNNKDLIASGRHWQWLQLFAAGYLDDPEELTIYSEDHELPETALCNCLPSLESQLPGLREMAELHCKSKSWNLEYILYAACLAVFRRFKSLSGVSKNALAVLKTNIDVGYPAVDTDMQMRFEAEIDRRLFRTEGDVNDFAQEYLGVQLETGGCKRAKMRWLQTKPEFAHLLEELPLKWLSRYPEASLEALDVLFELAVENGDRARVVALISQRATEYCHEQSNQTQQQDVDARHSFWMARRLFFVQDGADEVSKWLSSNPNTIFVLSDRNDEMNRSGNRKWPDLSAESIHLILDAFIDLWPKVPLPNSWGTGSPEGETAYRYIRDIVWSIEKDDPKRSLPVLDSVIGDCRFQDFLDTLRSMRAAAQRRIALSEFEAPTPWQIAQMLDKNMLASVEDLRALMCEELIELQQAIKGSEFDPIEKFYSGGMRVDETAASKRIGEHLQLRLTGKNIPISIEHQLNDKGRCDITATAMVDGKRILLVMEVKGQWSRELYTAAEKQLHVRYSMHPDAEEQGIYLVLWFGKNEKVAESHNHAITSSEDLKFSVISRMAEELRGSIDVFVLDLSVSKV